MTGRPRRGLPLLVGLWFTAHGFTVSAAPMQDPDWPCQQRLVPELTAGTYWMGAPIPDGIDWRSDPPIARLVEAVSPREVPTDVGTAKILAFAKALKGGEQARILSAAFAGILDETNRQRSQIIERLKELTRRQRDIAVQVAKVTDEVNAIPADATGEDANRRADALGRQALLTRIFDETRGTMRYACEVPTQLEARFGAYARALQTAP